MYLFKDQSIVLSVLCKDTLGDVALKTLPAILPPLPYKMGWKMVRPSYQIC